MYIYRERNKCNYDEQTIGLCYARHYSSPLSILSNLILIITLRNWCYDPHFTYEKTETQKDSTVISGGGRIQAEVI